MVTKVEQLVRDTFSEYDDGLLNLDELLDHIRHDMRRLKQVSQSREGELKDWSRALGCAANSVSVGGVIKSNVEEIKELNAVIGGLNLDHKRSMNEIKYLSTIIRIAVGLISTTEYWKDKHPEECYKWLMGQVAKPNTNHSIYTHGWVMDVANGYERE